ncbi:MAG: hypothetical protein RI883_843 [Bacteroidota bacterium]|jgi:hypothetical protein
MSHQEIEDLVDHTEELCVSIVLPTHRLAPERFQDPLVFKKIVAEVKNLLNDKKESKKKITAVIENLEGQYEMIDFNHSLDGIGIFVSPTVSKMIQFPFPVTQKISVSDTFYARDLLYYLQMTVDYYVLSLQENDIRLFKGNGEKLSEILNEDFPMEYDESYEYSHSTRNSNFGSNVLKQFEKDEGEIQEIRMKTFFDSADGRMEKYEYYGRPILLAGDKHELANFMKLTKNSDNVIGMLEGNFNFEVLEKFAKKVWDEVKQSFQEAHKKVISTLDELVGSEMVAVGINDVWRTADEGKGLELIVEKELIRPAYFSKDKYMMKLENQPNDESYKRINDLVETIIQTVRSKNGKVIFVENGSMEDYDGIALKLRYPDLG